MRFLLPKICAPSARANNRRTRKPTTIKSCKASKHIFLTPASSAPGHCTRGTKHFQAGGYSVKRCSLWLPHRQKGVTRLHSGHSAGSRDVSSSKHHRGCCQRIGMRKTSTGKLAAEHCLTYRNRCTPAEELWVDETVLVAWRQKPVEHALAKEMARCQLEKLVGRLLPGGLKRRRPRRDPRRLVAVPTHSRSSTPTFFG